MDQGPLVDLQIDAGERLIGGFAHYTPVQAAFWVKEAESNQWFLYIAGDQIDDSNFDLAYSEVLRLLLGAPERWLDPFQVKVIGVNHPVAQAVMEIQQKYPRNLATRYYGRQLGGLSVEEVYIYPLPSTAQP
jgi:hypothetical protein